MGLQLPGELIGLLGMLGYTWPEADESKLFELGSTWMSFGGTVQGVVGDADAAAQQVWSGNKGEDIDAFKNAWAAEDSPAQMLRTSATSSMIVGGVFFLCAGIVLILKINVIIQLIMLAIQIAQAIATAAVTFGASLLEIPIFKEIAGMIIDMLIDQAIGALLG
ncbi:WXG100-like domain-containing protein [Actinomadura rudentiformis]|uniref:Outer membrane channel protein CpnT-like N-terminal domain-containing protein n=1 Tax=Actinomadura rudentiformis TaxID=359158 RepID=A0A6H9Z076_9ACTN|nr:hypothetical protein [Actinomadura rudentiformis]KAB2347846.1 hypothetical protein F8566_18305 [Actinomadura rudentiformis]